MSDRWTAPWSVGMYAQIEREFRVDDRSVCSVVCCRCGRRVLWSFKKEKGACRRGRFDDDDCSVFYCGSCLEKIKGGEKSG